MALSGFFKTFNCASTNASKPKTKPKLKRNESNVSNGHGPSAPPDVIANTDSSFSEDIQEDDVNDSRSFWDIGRYKIALKRCDNGAKLGADLIELLTERAKLDENYSKSLKNWKNKWSTYLQSDSTNEYGQTMKNAWLAFSKTGSETSEIHLKLSESLMNEPVNKVKEWLKVNYQKHIINYKKTKEFEDKFIEAQKNWSNLFNKMKKLEKEYKESIENTASCEKTSAAAESNPKILSEQRYKLVDKVLKAKVDQEKSREAYKNSVSEMDLYKGRYIKDMEEVFNLTQNFERERMMFFKTILNEAREKLEIQQDPRFDEIFLESQRIINGIMPDNDLDWWRRNYGTDTAANWPTFIDYEA